MNRSTLILVVLLLALGAIVWFLLPSGREREVSYSETAVIPRIDSASVIKVEIQKPSKTITIENVGGRWTITSPVNYPADAASVFQLVGGLSHLTVGSLISSNPEKQRLFQVDSTGTLLTVTDRGGKSVSMIIGKMGPSFSDVYMRLPKSSDVYLAQGIETWTVGKDLKEWRDKTIYSAPSESIKELTYTAGGKETKYDRDSAGWKSADKPVDASVMNPLLNSLSNLHADDFIDSAAKIESRPITVAIKGASSATLSLFPVAPDSSRYYVQTTGSPQTFVISKWTAQQFLKPVGIQSSSSKPAPAVAARSTPPRKPETATAPTGSKSAAENKTASAPKERAQAPALKAQQPPAQQTGGAKTPPAPTAAEPKTTKESVPSKSAAPPSQPPAAQPAAQPADNASEDEGDLIVHTVKKGETMLTIAEQYHVSMEKIKRWNLLKTTGVKPGQELYIYVKK